MKRLFIVILALFIVLVAQVPTGTRVWVLSLFSNDYELPDTMYFHWGDSLYLEMLVFEKMRGDSADIDTLNCDTLYSSAGAYLTRLFMGGNIDLNSNDIVEVDSLSGDDVVANWMKVDTLYVVVFADIDSANIENIANDSDYVCTGGAGDIKIGYNDGVGLYGIWDMDSTFGMAMGNNNEYDGAVFGKVIGHIGASGYIWLNNSAKLWWTHREDSAAYAYRDSVHAAQHVRASYIRPLTPGGYVRLETQGEGAQNAKLNLDYSKTIIWNTARLDLRVDGLVSVFKDSTLRGDSLISFKTPSGVVARLDTLGNFYANLVNVDTTTTTILNLNGSEFLWSTPADTAAKYAGDTANVLRAEMGDTAALYAHDTSDVVRAEIGDTAALYAKDTANAVRAEIADTADAWVKRRVVLWNMLEDDAVYPDGASREINSGTTQGWYSAFDGAMATDSIIIDSIRIVYMTSVNDVYIDSLFFYQGIIRNNLANYWVWGDGTDLGAGNTTRTGYSYTGVNTTVAADWRILWYCKVSTASEAGIGYLYTLIVYCHYK